MGEHYNVQIFGDTAGTLISGWMKNSRKDRKATKLAITVGSGTRFEGESDTDGGGDDAALTALENGGMSPLGDCFGDFLE